MTVTLFPTSKEPAVTTTVDIGTEVRETILSQIGRMNVLAISGGRAVPIPLGIKLPVAHGYSVEVILDEGSDTYTVTRVFTRAGTRFEKGQVEWVYCDEVGEIAYQASCYHHPFPRTPEV